jgi:aspartate kinase
MKIVIQKFGGTSVATEEGRKRVHSIIRDAKEKYDGIVVVVSAMGRYGAPYATDTLLGLIDHDFQVIHPCECDLLLSTGEIIASVVLSYELKKIGINAKAITGGQAGIVTNDDYMKAEVQYVDRYSLEALLKEGIVPVVAGFQGMTKDFTVTTLGRGGSDTTAALLGEALKAEAIEIYTDVDGIMTTDPKFCNEARTLATISYQEVFQMADSGAKVIHKGAVEVARRAGIPLIIKNTFTDHEGTAITDYHKMERLNTVQDKLITSIAHRIKRIQFSVVGTLDDDSFFVELAKKQVSIDIINIFPNFRVFTTDADKEREAIEVMQQFNANYSLIRDCAKVTVIGERMTGVPGVMSKIIHGLKVEGIEILQSADSLSTISCLILEKDVQKAVNALHKTFEL